MIRNIWDIFIPNFGLVQYETKCFVKVNNFFQNVWGKLNNLNYHTFTKHLFRDTKLDKPHAKFGACDKIGIYHGLLREYLVTLLATIKVYSPVQLLVDPIKYIFSIAIISVAILSFRKGTI